MKITSEEKLREMVTGFVKEEKEEAEAFRVFGFVLAIPFIYGAIASGVAEPRDASYETIRLAFHLVCVFAGILLFGAFTIKGLLSYLPARKKANEETYTYHWLDVVEYAAGENGIICNYSYNGVKYSVPLGEFTIDENVTVERKVHVFDFGTAERPRLYAALDKED